MGGRIFVYGDDIDTDRIIPGKYTKTLDRRELAAHVFEDLDPNFRLEVRAGDIVVAGHNFGCGSSREQAAIAMQEAGVALLLAQSFARIFFRNAINIGLPVVEIVEHTIVADSRLTYDISAGWVRDEAQGKTYAVTALPPFLQEIMAVGGLVPYLRQHGRYPSVN